MLNKYPIHFAKGNSNKLPFYKVTINYPIGRNNYL